MRNYISQLSESEFLIITKAAMILETGYPPLTINHLMCVNNEIIFSRGARNYF